MNLHYSTRIGGLDRVIAPAWGHVLRRHICAPVNPPRDADEVRGNATPGPVTVGMAPRLAKNHKLR